MNGVTAFVQHRFDILVGSCGVHENEGSLTVVKTGAIAAGRLAFTTVEVEELFASHRGDAFAENWADMSQRCFGSRRQFIDILERLQAGASCWINEDIPRTQF